MPIHDHYPADTILREHGYRIAHRRNVSKGEEPLWERKGKLVTESEAIASLPVEARKKLRGKARL